MLSSGVYWMFFNPYREFLKMTVFCNPRRNQYMQPKLQQHDMPRFFPRFPFGTWRLILSSGRVWGREHQIWFPFTFFYIHRLFRRSNGGGGGRWIRTSRVILDAMTDSKHRDDDGITISVWSWYQQDPEEMWARNRSHLFPGWIKKKKNGKNRCRTHLNFVGLIQWNFFHSSSSPFLCQKLR